MKISFITTFLNEEETILRFLESLLSQTLMPDEIILVDGGSTDNTLPLVKKYIAKKKGKTAIVLLSLKGNRSVGRNAAIKKATGDIIACSDAGNILDALWLEEICKPFKNRSIEVVAGYYSSKPTTPFQQAIVPYVLVMPQNVDPDTFLPATRSVAFKKSAWQKVHGFDENLSHNEDYHLAKKFKREGFRMVFAPEAIVYWLPRKTLKEAFIMFKRFAYGDIESGLYRGKVQLLFVRYFLAGYLGFLSILFRSLNPAILLGAFFAAYMVWAVWKNHRFVKREAVVFLPLIQLTADAAVLFGSILGILHNGRKAAASSFGKAPYFALPVVLYTVLLFSLISWGLPGGDHPFTYHMDEWHQLQSVRHVFSEGNPNTPGAAYGSMLQFVLSGIYLIPFVILGLINPFAITSSFDQLPMQARMFEVLRSNTLLFGTVSLIGIGFIAKKYLKISLLPTMLLFLLNPLFLSLSNYFKYDIALLAWIVIGIGLTFFYAEKPSLSRYLSVSFAFGCALATKISVVPLFPLMIFSYYLYTQKKERNIFTPVLGTVIFLGTFILLGIPNVFFGKGDYTEFLYSNLVSVPSETSNYLLPMPYQLYLLFRQYPFIFGYALYLTAAVAVLFFLYSFFVEFLRSKKVNYKNQLFLIAGLLLMLASLYPLKIVGTGNRAVVLLPFLVLLCTMLVSKLLKRKKTALAIVLCLMLLLQSIQSFPWLSMKWQDDPRQSSSRWILGNTAKGSEIGVENIPIYQYLPDIALREFYQLERGLPVRNTYRVVDAQTASLPDVIIISNADIAEKYLHASPKKQLLERMKNERFVKKAEFYPQGILVHQLINRLDFYIANLGPTAPVPAIFIYTKERPG